ncbi:F1 complex, delta/epsilon subunit of ATPase [Entophlyctis helioformis]|nr:F1 complex, delta/epsilon subunit of ATPase [Entophlyctis helioformis]
MMFRSLRLASASLGESRQVSRRSYATEAKGGSKLVLNFAVPHQAIHRAVEVKQVNLASTDGSMGILANHVPTIAQLKPGVIEVIGNDKTEKFFVSGGFAIVNPDSTLNINAVEAYPIAELDIEAAKRALGEVNKKLATGSEEDKITARIQAELFEAVVAAAKQ